MLINNWEWISDDEFLQVWSESFDSNSINYSTTRKIQSYPAYASTDGTLIKTWWASTDTRASSYVNGSLALADLSDCYVYYSWTLTNLSTWVTPLNVISIGNAISTYDETSNPLGIRHFFIQWGWIRYCNYNWSVSANLTVSSYTNAPVWACALLGRGKMLVSYGGDVFEINPHTNTPVVNNTWSPVFRLPNDASIWCLNYSYGMVWATYTLAWDNNTYIVWVQSSGTTYTINNYQTTIIGEKCIWATTEGNKTYWVSAQTLNSTDWGNNIILKRLKETDWQERGFYNWSWSRGQGACISVNKWLIRINAWTNGYYLYGSRNPSLKPQMTRVLLDSGDTIASWMKDECIMHCVRPSISNKFYINGNPELTPRYLATSQSISLPYTAGQYGQIKKGLWMRLWYSLPASNTSIIVKIITDNIIRASGDIYANYITLDTITDNTVTYRDITPSMISKALWTAWYSEEWSLIKILIQLVNGGTVWWLSNTRYSNTPDVYDLYIYHNEIQQV